MAIGTSGILTLSRLPQRMRGVLAAARELARRDGRRLYLAGGAVRDLLLSRTLRDLDLVLEGDIGGFAELLAGKFGADLKLHRRFGIAILDLPDGTRVDLAAARREAYAHPGALPTVSLGASIEEDLVRRDFTINAMALGILPGRRLLDPLGGRADLAASLIRSLHSRSFFDDPTRALRAVRYAGRLDFRIAPKTRRELSTAAVSGAFDLVSGQRLSRELALLFSEPDRSRAIAALRRLGVDEAIAPVLAHSGPAPERAAWAEAASRRQALSLSWLCYLLVWMGNAAEADCARLSERLALAGPEKQRVRAWAATLARLGNDALRAAERASDVSADEVVAAAACGAKAAREALLSGLARQPVRLAIRGADLLAAGVPPGPSVGAALAATLQARLSGRIAPNEELAFALGAVRRKPGEPA